MPRKFGPLLGAFARGFLDLIPYANPERVAQLQQLAQKGSLVYVHRSRNVVDYLYLSRALPQHDLPWAGYVGGLNVSLFQAPTLRNLPAFPGDPVAHEERLLQETLRSDLAAMVFLKKPLTLTNPRPTHRADHIRALVELQQQQERPIYLVPQLLIFSQKPGRFSPTLGDTVFGSPEEPGLLRALLKLLLHRGKGQLLVGEPVDLRQFVENNSEHSVKVLTKKVRWVLSRYLSREDRVHNGPPLKSPARMKLETLRDNSLRQTITELAKQQDQPEAKLQRLAQQMHNEIAARFDINMINALDFLLALIFGKIYDGIEIAEEDIERLRQAMRRGPVVLVPSHRSHVDYLVISYLMTNHRLIPPHIAAGVNLSFWPLGAIFRRAGAFFLRRSFRGDPLYAAVFRAYIKKLMREGFSQEFFIDGTRSRSGKSLIPKLGLLSMEIDAFFESGQEDLLFVPISIGYEKVIEEREYQRELMGGSKAKEGVGGLLKATGVLRSRYGRVYVTVDEPISFSQFIQQRQLDRHDHSPEERRDIVQALGFRIVRGIDQVTPVTPTALASAALLGHPGRTLPHSVLVTYSRRMLLHIQDATKGSARLSPALLDLEAAMRTAMGRLNDEGSVSVESAGGEVYYRLVRGRRNLLDRYKNSILHFFVGEALVATVIDASTTASKPTPINVVRQRTRELCQLLRKEFVFPQRSQFDTTFEATLQRAERNGYLHIEEQRVAVPSDPLSRGLHRFVVSLLANFIEGYWVAMRSVAIICVQPVPQKELVARIRDDIRASFLAGEIFYEEAISKVLVENAVLLLQSKGVLCGDKRSGLQLSSNWSQERLQTMADEIAIYLPK